MDSGDASRYENDMPPLKPSVTRTSKLYNLDRPMTEYYISSSHNTYLLGPQVGGASSVDGYIAALLRGCRCVEVDCWDGVDGLPRVKHGKAFNTSIALDHAMETINQYAFVASPYPLWISLEMHCCPTQEVTVEVIKQAFGPRLISKPLDPSSDEIPSPEQLRERVLIKVKEVHRSGMVQTLRELLKRRTVQERPTATRLLQPQGLRWSDSCSQGILQSSRERPSGSTSCDPCHKAHAIQHDLSQISSRGIAKSLANLGVYATGVNPTKFNGVNRGWKYNQIISLPESKIKKFIYAQTTKSELQRHSNHYLVRVYPNWYRLGSRNFNRCIFWQSGVQMVALNWQTSDEGFQINDAMFAVGADQSGYVLKPPNLRGSISSPSGLNDYKEVLLNIHIISVHKIPSSLAVNRRAKARVGAEFVRGGGSERGWLLDHIPVHIRNDPTRIRTPDVFIDDRCANFNTSLSLRVENAHPDLIFLRLSLEIREIYKGFRTWREVAMKIIKVGHMWRGHCCVMPLKCQSLEDILLPTLFYKVESGHVQQL